MTRRRAATMVLALVPLALPLEAAVALTLAINVVAVAVGTVVLRRRRLLSNRVVWVMHAGVATAAAGGGVLRVLESAANGGGFEFPGLSDLVVLPGYLGLIAGVYLLASSRQAISRAGDLLEALAAGLALVVPLAIVMAPYLADGTQPWGARALLGVYTLLDVALFALFIRLVMGPGMRDGAARLASAAGLSLVVFDLVTTLETAGVIALPLEAIKFLSVPVVLYVLGATHPGYHRFTQPAAVSVRYRDRCFLVALVATPATALYVGVTTQSPRVVLLSAVGGLGALAVAARLLEQTAISRRLETIADTHRALAHRLQGASSVDQVLGGASYAVMGLIGDRAAVRVEATILGRTCVDEAGDGPRIGGGAPAQFPFPDSSGSITVWGPPVTGYLWIAIEQISASTALTVRALTAREQALADQAQSHARERWDLLTQTSGEVALMIDAGGHVVDCSPQTGRVLGFDPLGASLLDLFGVAADGLRDGCPALEVRARRDDGDRWWSLAAKDFGDHPVMPGRVVWARDITDRVRAERWDPLTGLPNTRALATSDLPEEGTLVLLNLDGFRKINDSWGYQRGDELLGGVAARLAGVVRDGDVLYRGSNDDFVWVVPGRQLSVEAVTERIQVVCQRPFQGGGALRSVTLSVSAGVVHLTAEHRTAHEALRAADTALGRAKQLGRGRTVLYEPEMQARVQRTLELELDLLGATSDPSANGFTLAYQPLVDAGTGRPVAIEALMRWQGPSGVRVSPGEFIPVAEELGLMQQLDAWMFERAVTDLADLRRQWPDLGLQVNLSPIPTTTGHLDDLARLVVHHLGGPRAVTIEVTESATGQQAFSTVLAKLDELRQSGFGISIDDFGVGESNFARLANLPITQVKLAGLFSERLGERAQAGVVRRVCDTIHHLGCDVVIEGVEDQDQWDAVTAVGADLVQGYLLARPLPLDELRRWLTGRTPPAPGRTPPAPGRTDDRALPAESPAVAGS